MLCGTLMLMRAELHLQGDMGYAPLKEGEGEVDQLSVPFTHVRPTGHGS